MMGLEFLHLDNIFGLILTAGAVYGAIRTDIKNIHEKINDIKDSSDEAHKRIDALLMKIQ